MTNAIIHGYEEKKGAVELFCAYKENKIYIEVPNIVLSNMDKYLKENLESSSLWFHLGFLKELIYSDDKQACECYKKALELGLKIASELGLETRNCENYIGYAEIPVPGEEKYIATVTHLDVVPVGEGWTKSPFEMWEKDGYIIGRGVMDDKGPSVICLYALKYLKERNIPLRYPRREQHSQGCLYSQDLRYQVCRYR